MHSEIYHSNLATDNINPRVLVSYLYLQGSEMPKGYHLPKRYVYDYELEFFVHSEGAMFIEEKLYPIQKGDIVFRRPGQTTQAIMPYCCYMISFDMTGTSGKSAESYDFCTEKGQQFQDYYNHPMLDSIPSVFHPQFPEKYLDLFDSVLREFINPSENSSLLLKAYTIQILCTLSQDVCNPLNHQTVLQSPHGRIIKKTMEYIQANLNSPLSLESLAKLAGLSPTYFHKIFRDITGVALNSYITKLRIEKAKELLVRTMIPVYQIAQECGFENIPYFSSLFKKHQGISPAEFRKRHSYIY